MKKNDSDVIIDLQEGFYLKEQGSSDDLLVLVFADGKKVFEEPVHTNPRIAVAAGFPINAKKRVFSLEIKIPEKKLSQKFEIDTAKGKFIGISLQGNSQFKTIQQKERFRYE